MANGPTNGLKSTALLIGGLFIIGLTLDTSARIQRSERRYQLVFDNTPVGFMHFDKTGTITDCNDKFADIIGAPKEKVVGFNMIRQLRNGQLRQAVAAALKGEVGYYEGDYVSVIVGKSTPVKAIFQPIILADGALSGGVSIFEDVTARKRAEDILKQSEAQKRLLLESMGELVAFEDQDLRILWANRAAGSSIGEDPENLVGRLCYEVWQQRQHPCENCPVQEAIKTGQPQERETSSPDGRWWSLKAYPAYDEHGDLAGVVEVSRDISAQRQAEAALQESEAKFRTLVMNIPSRVFKGYADWTVEFFDENIEGISGYPTQDFNTGKIKWRELIVPEDLERIRQIFIQALRTDKSYLREYRIRNRAGEILWVRERGRIFCRPDGRIDYVTGVFSDITAYKRLELELEQLRHRQELILNTAGEGIFGLDEHGSVTFVNQAALTMIGYDRQIVIGRSIHELLHHSFANGQAHSQEECSIYATLRDGQPHLLNDDVFWRQDGSCFPVECIVTPMSDGDRIVGAVVVFKDISVRKQAEEALRESEQRFQDITKHAVEWVWEVDPQGKYLYSSSVVENLLGYRPEEMLEKHFYDLFHPEDREELTAKAFKAFAAKQPFCDFVNRDLHKNGATVWMSTSGGPVLDYNGDLKGYRGVHIDITAAKQAEAALHQANATLRALLEKYEQHNREISLINKMAEFFQVCNSAEEAYPVIARFVGDLFPARAGALFMLNASKNLVETVATWGESLSGEHIFSPEDCWALRRSRLYLYQKAAAGIRCPHLSGSPITNYLCAPLQAQGEHLGMLHVQDLSNLSLDQDEENKESLHELVTTTVDHIAMALANLKLRETLRQQAIRDVLTGLFNRRFLEETLEQELQRAKRKETPLGVIMLDLDHFKRFNDDYGHEAGDILLRTLGDFLKAHIRAGDIACRYGGEEFVLVLPETPLEVTDKRAEAIREGVSRLQVFQRGQLLESITVSLGVAVFPDHGETKEDVLRAADDALYQAKAAGRNRVVVAERETALLS